MMTIWNETTKELLGKTTTKVVRRLTHASIDKTRNELANIGASAKTTHTAFPKRKNLDMWRR